MNDNKKMRALPEIKKIISLLIISVIAYLSNAEAGIISAFPIWFIALTIAFLFADGGYLAFAVAFCSAAAFSLLMGQGIKYAVIYAFLYMGYAIAAYFAAKLLKKGFCNKRAVNIIIAVPIIGMAILLQYLYAGSIGGNIGAKNAASDYLENKYTAQEFIDTEAYFDAFENEYKVFASYNYNGNILESAISYKKGEIISDGFYDALCEWMLGKEKGNMITALRKDNDDNFSIEAEQFDMKDENGAIGIIFGQDDISEYDKIMNYKITFGDPITQKRIFSAKCEEYAEKLGGIDFGSIEFIALDKSGKAAFSCKLAPDTAKNDIYSLCEAAK